MPKLFLDSGGYSAYSNGTTVDIHAYIDFIKEHEKEIEVYANLDDIGSAEQSWKNQRIMERAGLNPIPVYHLDEDPKYLRWAMEYPYFAVGGLASARGVSLSPFLDSVFRKVCTKESDFFPTHKVHGFGMATPEIISRYPWFCMTEEEHTVLTKTGWASLSELTVGTEILSFDKGLMEWQKIEELPVFEVTDVEIRHTSNRTFEAFTTENHRWITSDFDHEKKGKVFEWRTTKTLRTRDCINRVGKDYKFLDEPIWSDEQVALLAWAWTDGSIGMNESIDVRIHQSEKANPQKCQIIKNLLIKSGEKFWESHSETGMVDFQLHGNISKWITRTAPNKKLPIDLPLQLTRQQALSFVENSILADGCVSGLKRKKGFCIAVFREVKKENLEILRIICLLLGIPTSMNKGRYTNLISSSVDFVYVNKLYEEKIKYSGRLWCVRVKTNAFFTKCRDKIYVTGNSIDSTSWAQYSRFGLVLIPKRINNKYRYDLPPYIITVSSRSKAIGDAKHLRNLGKLEQEWITNYCESKECPIGRTLFKSVSSDYKLKNNEHFTDRKKKDRVEVIVTMGLCNNGELRDKLNLLYFLDLERNQPLYPWRWLIEEAPLFS